MAGYDHYNSGRIFLGSYGAGAAKFVSAASASKLELVKQVKEFVIPVIKS